jgi:Fe-S oxidoreductase
VTGVSLVMAMLGLSIITRSVSGNCAGGCGRTCASDRENTSAAVAFSDADAAREILASVRVRDVVTRACPTCPMAVSSPILHTDR